MQRTEAVKVLSKMLGKSLGYRVDDKAPTPEERQRAKEDHPRLAAARKIAEEAVRTRRDAILAADSEYQRLVAAWKASKEKCDQAFSKSHHYKFTVGTSSGLFFHVKAEGDSWEQIISKLKNGA